MIKVINIVLGRIGKVGTVVAYQKIAQNKMMEFVQTIILMLQTGSNIKHVQMKMNVAMKKSSTLQFKEINSLVFLKIQLIHLMMAIYVVTYSKLHKKWVNGINFIYKLSKWKMCIFIYKKPKIIVIFST